MALKRSFVPLPDFAIVAGGTIQTALLAAAVFALGLGVQVRKLIKVGLPLHPRGTVHRDRRRHSLRRGDALRVI